MSDMGEMYKQIGRQGAASSAHYPGEVADDSDQLSGMNAHLAASDAYYNTMRDSERWDERESIPWPPQLKHVERNWKDDFPLTAQGESDISQTLANEEMVHEWDRSQGMPDMGPMGSMGPHRGEWTEESTIKPSAVRAARQDALGRRFRSMLEQHGSSLDTEVAEASSSLFSRRLCGEAPGTVVFDLDGVLSDSRWRLPVIRENGPDIMIENRGQVEGWSPEEFPQVGFMVGSREERWSAFYNLAMWDRVYPAGEALYRTFRALGFATAFWTGRPEEQRFHTLSWLMANDLLPFGVDRRTVSDATSYSWMYMREDNDRTPARALKMKFSDHWVGIKGTNPTLVLDDDISVVQGLSALGIPAVAPLWHGEDIRHSRG